MAARSICSSSIPFLKKHVVPKGAYNMCDDEDDKDDGDDEEMDDALDFEKAQTDVWPTDNQDIVRYLINKQKFDGSWDLDSQSIQRLTGKSLSDFEQSTNSQMLVSAIVIAVLETRFASFSAMWHGVVQKARKRLIDLFGKDSNKLQNLLENIRKKL